MQCTVLKCLALYGYVKGFTGRKLLSHVNRERVSRWRLSISQTISEIITPHYKCGLVYGSFEE